MKRADFLAGLCIFIAVFSVSCDNSQSGRLLAELPDFENRLERVRQRLDIPAFSAAIAIDSEVVWSKGFGLANIENRVPATDTTAYLLASLTKPFASTVIMHLVEQGKIDLEAPISQYGISLDTAREFGMSLVSEDSIKVRHLFSHTAEGIPGSRYAYNGYLYSFLDGVIKEASGQTFGQLVISEIIRPLGLRHTVPNICDTVNFALAGIDSSAYAANLATGYRRDSLNILRESNYETYFGVSAGLMTTAVDIARFSIAMDQDRFLDKRTKQLAYTPTISNSGDTLPYGLGWFTEEYKGERLVWHYGLWHTNSSIIIKAPDKKLTFVILANSDALTMPTALGEGYLLTSQIAADFLSTFLYPDDDIPVIDYDEDEERLIEELKALSDSEHRSWLKKQLTGMSRFHYFRGEMKRAEELMRVYGKVFAKPLPKELTGAKVLAKIDSVENDAARSVEFRLTRATNVRIFGIGEGLRQMVDFGWIEDITGDNVIWEMTQEQTSHAGGSFKNRLVDKEILMQPGRYRLRYTSDDSHCYMEWNADPPEYDFYGIAVYDTGKPVQ